MHVHFKRGFKNQQWQKYKEAEDLVGKRLQSTMGAYQYVVGTRRNQLERPLEKIEQLRSARGLEAAGDDAD